jgi:hypothetical protein
MPEANKIQDDLTAQKLKSMTQLPTPDETMVDQILLEAHTISEDILYRYTNGIVIAQTWGEIRGLIVRQSQTIRRLQSELAAANARADGEYVRGIEHAANLIESVKPISASGWEQTLAILRAIFKTHAIAIRALLPNSKKEPHDAT